MNAPVVLGLDFGGTKIAAAVCEISGDRIGSVTVPSGAEDGGQASLERGVAAAQALLDEVASGATSSSAWVDAPVPQPRSSSRSPAPRSRSPIRRAVIRKCSW